MAYRASYGADTYGTAFYGVTGAIDGDATVTPSASVSCSAVAVREASVSITASASVSQPQADVVIDGATTMTLQTVTVTIAEEYTEADGYRTGYGLRTYGTQIYGRNDSIEYGAASISASLTPTVSYERKRNADASITVEAGFSSQGVFSLIGSASMSASLSVTGDFIRVTEATATSAFALTIATRGIEKWEPVPSTAEIWTPVGWSRAA